MDKMEKRERKRSLAARYHRNVLSMEEKELKVAAALDGPQKNMDTMTMDQLREKVLKWMFSKNLSMRHEFVFQENANDELYILMGKTCHCCQGEITDAPSTTDRVRFTSTSSSNGDPSISIENMPRKSSRSPSIPTIFVPKTMLSPGGQRVAPITTQPAPVSSNGNASSSNGKKNGIDQNKKKKGEDEEETNNCCCCVLYRECGLLLMNVC